MRGTGALALVFCLLMIACGQDPARSVKITDRPADARPPDSRPAETPAPTSTADAKQPAATTPAGAAAEPQAAEWRLDACPPLPEAGGGPSDFTVTGPCAFRHHGQVGCESLGDDFIVIMSRKAAHGATVMVYINVEKYHGPGVYDGAQMFVGVQHKTNIYKWSNDAVDITVGPDEKFAVLPTTRVEAEPLLVDCTGPMTDFQCGGRDQVTAFERSVEVVSGTLQCQPSEHK